MPEPTLSQTSDTQTSDTQTSDSVLPEPLPTEPLDAPPESLLRPGRRKLWDIPHKYHCPVIGTCFCVADLRRIALRFVPRGTAPPSDYEVHVSFVGAATTRNALSIAAHKSLERRYQSAVMRFARARDADALRDLWSESLARGEVPGAFWALMTHGKADAAVLALAFEEVHMLSHQVGAGLRADLKRLAETQRDLNTLKRESDTLQRRARDQADEREARIRQLEQALVAREAEVARLAERERVLSARIAFLDGGESARQSAELEVRLASLKIRLAVAEREIVCERSRQDEAQRHGEAQGLALQEKQAECEALERLLTESLAQGMADGCDACPDLDCPRRADLAGRLVLCVGGRLPHVQEFGRLVARCNGRFDHHDGGLEDGAHRLESLLAGADAVVCATDFVSHAAYYRTKRYCKHHEKPHVLLQRSGLAAFALALERVAG